MKSKYRRYILQYEYLQIDYEEILSGCQEAKQEIEKYLLENHAEEYSKIHGGANPEPPGTEIQTTEDIEEEVYNNSKEIEELAKEDSKNKDLKRLYRALALKTHPDTVKDEDLNSIFMDALDAYSTNDLAKLLVLASELRVSVEKLETNSIELIKNNIQNLHTQIEQRKQTVAWAWFNAKDDLTKQNLIKLILKAT